MPKFTAGTDPVRLPDLGGSIHMPFVGQDKREEFVVSFTRSSISLVKRNHHLRGRRVIGLARLDLDGPGHRNPDGVEVGPRHLHVYREGFGLKYAFDIPAGVFNDLDDAFVTLEDFLGYCRVMTAPPLRPSLFSR